MKANWKMRIMLAVVGIMLVLIGAYVSGMEWQRGDVALGVYIGAIAGAIVGITCPVFDK